MAASRSHQASGSRVLNPRSRPHLQPLLKHVIPRFLPPQPFKRDYLTGIITGGARLDGVEGDTFAADLHERDGNTEYWRRATGEKVRAEGRGHGRDIVRLRSALSARQAYLSNPGQAEVSSRQMDLLWNVADAAANAGPATAADLWARGLLCEPLLAVQAGRPGVHDPAALRRAAG